MHLLIVNNLLICNVQLRHVERSVAQSKHHPEGYLVKMGAEVRKFMYGVLPRNYPTCERVLARFTSGIVAYGR